MNAFAAEPLKVFLLDDHALVRRGIRDLLSAARDIVVVGESDSATTAAAMILGSSTDVMVLDLNLQDGTGIHVCRDVRAADPSITGLLLTAAGDDEAAIASVLAGAAGYSVKAARSADIVGHVRAVGLGKQLIDRHVAEELIVHLDEVRPALTERQHRIATEVARGMTNRELAAALGTDEAEVAADVDVVIEAVTGLQRTPSTMRAAARGRHSRSGDAP